MSLSNADNGESFPGSDLSVTQLLDAAKRKLRGPTFGGRTTTTKDPFEVARFEQDVLELLRLVRSVKNSFVPISRIPPELLSLVARNLGEDNMDKTLIALTHTCQRWREIFVVDSSLWTRLECTNVEKTRVYLQRSKSSSLEIVLHTTAPSYRKDAFSLVYPHIPRVLSVTIEGGRNLFHILKVHFSCPTPFLRNLDLDFTAIFPLPVLSNDLLGGNLSSLHKLTLSGVDPHLPWRNLLNLTSFSLLAVPGEKISVARLLNLFANATYLSEIKLGSMPDSSDAPPGRVVPLPYLKHLTILTELEPSSILLDHLSIPPGASLHLEFIVSGDESLLRNFLPTVSHNLQNISNITSLHLDYHRKYVLIELNGPSGKLYVRGYRDRRSSSMIPDHILLRSLDNFTLSGIQELRVTMYEFSNRRGRDPSSPRHVLGAMGDLRTLSLDRGNHLPFILTLNPDHHPSELVLCPKLESLVIDDEDQWSFCASELAIMTKARTSKGVKLQSITLIGLDKPLPKEVMFRLKEYVTFVETRPPQWALR